MNKTELLEKIDKLTTIYSLLLAIATYNYDYIATILLKNESKKLR